MLFTMVSLSYPVEQLASRRLATLLFVVRCCSSVRIPPHVWIQKRHDQRDGHPASHLLGICTCSYLAHETSVSSSVVPSLETGCETDTRARFPRKKKDAFRINTSIITTIIPCGQCADIRTSPHSNARILPLGRGLELLREPVAWIKKKNESKHTKPRWSFTVFLGRSLDELGNIPSIRTGFSKLDRLGYSTRRLLTARRIIIQCRQCCGSYLTFLTAHGKGTASMIYYS